MGVSYSDNQNSNSEITIYNRNRGAVTSTPLPLRNDLSFYTNTIFYTELVQNINP